MSGDIILLQSINLKKMNMKIIPKHKQIPVRDVGIAWSHTHPSCIAFCYPLHLPTANLSFLPFIVKGEMTKVTEFLSNQGIPMVVHYDMFNAFQKKRYAIYGLDKGYKVEPIVLTRFNPITSSKEPHRRFYIIVKHSGKIIYGKSVRQISRGWMVELNQFLPQNVIDEMNHIHYPEATKEKQKSELQKIIDKIEPDGYKKSLHKWKTDINGNPIPVIEPNDDDDSELNHTHNPPGTFSFKVGKKRETNACKEISIPKASQVSMRKILQNHEIIPLTPDKAERKMKIVQCRKSMMTMLKKTGAI